MKAARLLHRARRRAGLTQGELADRSGVAQPTIARIETGASDPRFDTLSRLLRACGRRITTEEVRGLGVDRTALRENLRLSPVERLRALARAARGLDDLLRLARPVESGHGQDSLETDATADPAAETSGRGANGA